jgi:hypothetical protein
VQSLRHASVYPWCAMAKAFGLTFSDKFGVDEVWLQSKGIFNPTLDVDSPLFIDPFLLPHSNHKEFSECAFEAYEAHFSEILRLLLISENVGDKAWVAALNKFKFSEAKGMGGTCLGYSANSTNHGKAFGKTKSLRSLSWAQGVVRLGVKDPEMFSSLPLFEDGVGPDLISDMITNITLPCILKFNERVLALVEKELGIKVPTRKFTLKGETAVLPENPHAPGSPIILLADDILKHLPLMSDPLGLAGMAEHNSDLRDRVNAHIGEVFKIRHKKDKERISAQALETAQAFQAFLDLLKLAEKAPYNLYQDPQGLVAWRSLASNYTAINKLKIEDNPKLSRVERIDAVCEAIIKQFTLAVETQRMWRVFYVDQKPRPERFAQLLFQAIATAYCTANDLDISPESDAGAGPVDFKFSDGGDKVVVEIKLSTNSSVVKGYEKQLKAYMDAEDTSLGHYVLIDVGKIGNAWDRLQAVAKKDADFRKTRRIHLVDGTYKVSASKLP